MVIPMDSNKLVSSCCQTLARRRILRFGKIFASFVPLPRLFRDLLLLSARITLAVITASVRLIVPPFKKSLLGETVLIIIAVIAHLICIKKYAMIKIMIKYQQIITGAGHGIGRELALQLAALGCVVVCWDTDVEANRLTMSIVSKDGGEVHGFAVDVSKKFEVRETVRLMRKAGIPDVTILINNASVVLNRPFLDYDDDDIRKIFDVNVLAQFWTIQSFLPSMLCNRKGHIVSVCNFNGFHGTPNGIPYSSSNFAIRGLMEGLYEELRLNAKNSNIHLTTVYPVSDDTDLDKNKNYRYEIATAKYAAKEIIRAIQRNYKECSIPRWLIYLNAISRILPDNARYHISDFFNNIR